MDTLIVTQSIFYVVASLAIIVIGVLLVLVIYQLLRILKSTRKVSEDLNETFLRAKQGVKKIINIVRK